MKRVLPIVLSSCLLASVLLLNAQAIDPRSFINGCNDCGGAVTALCDGHKSTESEEHNFYVVITGWNTCSYDEIYHNTIEYCDVDPTHKNPGEVILAGEEGHMYDDTGRNLCGKSDIEPCGIGEIAYKS